MVCILNRLEQSIFIIRPKECGRLKYLPFTIWKSCQTFPSYTSSNTSTVPCLFRQCSTHVQDCHQLSVLYLGFPSLQYNLGTSYAYPTAHRQYSMHISPVAWTFLGVAILQSQDVTLCLCPVLFGNTCIECPSVLQSQDATLCLCPALSLVQHAWTFLGVSFNPKMSHYVCVQCSFW